MLERNLPIFRFMTMVGDSNSKIKIVIKIAQKPFKNFTPLKRQINSLLEYQLLFFKKFKTLFRLS